MNGLKKIGRLSAALVALIATATVVVWASVMDVTMENNTGYEVPVTIHCECGYHTTIDLEAFSTIVEQMPSAVSYLIINQTTVYHGTSQNVQLATGDIINAQYMGDHDDPVLILTP